MAVKSQQQLLPTFYETIYPRCMGFNDEETQIYW